MQEVVNVLRQRLRELNDQWAARCKELEAKLAVMTAARDEVAAHLASILDREGAPMTRIRHDARGRVVQCSPRDIFECCECRKRLTGIELQTRFFYSGLCACGGIVHHVVNGRPRPRDVDE